MRVNFLSIFAEPAITLLLVFLISFRAIIMSCYKSGRIKAVKERETNPK
jgi:hypothetical protein